MSTSTISTSDGDVTITRTDDAPSTPPVPPAPAAPVILHRDGFAVGVHSDKPLDGASFIAGLMLGMLLLFIVQSAMKFYARREARKQRDAASIGPAEDRMAAEVAALARRTATLETIVTDPAQRTAHAIDALR